MSAAGHMIDDLHIPAIVGPNTSQDTITSRARSADRQHGADTQRRCVDDSPSSLEDDDLHLAEWPIRSPARASHDAQINAEETQLKAARSKTTLKSASFSRRPLGRGTRTETFLASQGELITEPSTKQNVRIDGYTRRDERRPSSTELPALRYTHIIALEERPRPSPG